MGMTSDGYKLVAGLGLLAAWTALVLMQVPHADELVSFLKYTLVGLASHYLTGTTPPK